MSRWDGWLVEFINGEKGQEMRDIASGLLTVPLVVSHVMRMVVVVVMRMVDGGTILPVPTVCTILPVPAGGQHLVQHLLPRHPSGWTDRLLPPRGNGQNLLCTVHCTMYTGNCTLYNVHCTLYTVHFTICSVQFSAYNLQCTANTDGHETTEIFIQIRL